MVGAARDMANLRFAWLPGDEDNNAGHGGRGGRRGCVGEGRGDGGASSGNRHEGPVEERKV